MSFLFLLSLLPCILSLEVSISVDEYVDFVPTKFGANQAWYREPLLYNDQQLQTYISDNRLRALRWPGGTNANFVDWQEGTVQGWPQDVVNGLDSKSKTKYNEQIETIRNQLNQNRNSGVSKIDEIFAYAGASYDGVMVVVVNVCGLDSDSSEELVEALYTGGYREDKLRFEIGNELYFKKYNGCADDGTHYATIAKEHATKMKNKWKTLDSNNNNIQISLVASRSPYTFDGQFGGSTKKVKPDYWNSELAKSLKSDADKSWFDALSIHMYSDYQDPNDADDAEIDDEERYLRSISHAAQRFDYAISSTVQEFKGAFSNQDLPIWLTEWHSKTQDNPVATRYLGGLYRVYNFMNIFKEKNIHIANFHSLSLTVNMPVDPCTCPGKSAFPITCPNGYQDKIKGEKCYAESYANGKLTGNEAMEFGVQVYAGIIKDKQCEKNMKVRDVKLNEKLLYTISGRFAGSYPIIDGVFFECNGGKAFLVLVNKLDEGPFTLDQVNYGGKAAMITDGYYIVTKFNFLDKSRELLGTEVKKLSIGSQEIASGIKLRWHSTTVLTLQI